MKLTCPTSGSDKIIPNANMVIQSQFSSSLQIAVAQHPEALVLKYPVVQHANAHVCGDCGAVQLVAENPGLLYQAYLASLQRYQDYLAALHHSSTDEQRY